MELTVFLQKDRARDQYYCLYIYFVLVYLLLSGILCNVSAYITINKDVVSCSSKPCRNGGSCVQDINNVMCNCREGFTGDMCEIENNKCASNPCKNKGECVDSINTYWCVCNEGFTGERCEEIDECASEPCENGGICFGGKNRYRCECRRGFTGKRCEELLIWSGYQVYFVDADASLVVLLAVCSLVIIGLLLMLVIDLSSRSDIGHSDPSSGERRRETQRYRPPPQRTSDEEEERAREHALDIFDEQFRANLRNVFAEMRRIDERKQYIKNRRTKHFEQFENKVLEIENNEHVIFAYNDIPWPSENATAEDKSVLLDYLDLTLSDFKYYVRQQQIRWHPDKFSQTFGNHIRESDRELIINRVTILSQEIYELL